MIDKSMFNEQQLEVIQHINGPIVVNASPGSGKSRCVTYRVVQLLESGVKPNRILACTFTKKAAEELRERIEKLYGEDASKVKISTLHSLAYKLLKQIETTPYSTIKISKPFDAWMFFDGLIKKNKNIKLKDIKQIINIISNLKLNLIRVADYEKKVKASIDDTRMNISNNHELAILFYYKEYTAWLNRDNKVDFSDMLMKTYYHLNNPKKESVRKSIVDKIDHLMIDEAQDMNLVSYELYKILGSKFNNVMACGDLKQSIYGFNGSHYTYMASFVNELNAVKKELPLNYRSTKTIIDHSNKLISVDETFADTNVITVNEVGAPVTATLSTDEIDEAHVICDKVQQYLNNGFKPKDIAILYRINAQAIPIADQLDGAKIPYMLFSKNSFYKRREVKQVVAYIKILHNPKSATFEDFKLISNAPLRYIKGSALEKLDDLMEDSFWKSVNANMYKLVGQERDSVQKLINDVAEGHAEVADRKMDTSEIVNYVMYELGFKAWLEGSEAVNDDVENTGDDDKYLNIEVLESSCKLKPNPEEFVAYAEEERDKVEVTKKRNAVTLMSCHASKGKEWPVVIVAGFCDKLMPYYRADDLPEERRIAYVAVTRAEKHLHLSVINGKYGRYNTAPTRYVSDMGVTNFERLLGGM